MSATVIGTGAIEIVSIATDIQTLTVVVPVLAHLNMILMLPSAGELNRIGKPATGTTSIALDCLHRLAVIAGKTTALSALVEALLVITMDVNDVSAKSNVRGPTSAEPTHASRVLAYWTMVMVPGALLQLGAVGRATRVQASATTRYVSICIMFAFCLLCHWMLTRQRARHSPRHDAKSKTPVPEPPKEEDRAIRSGSEEGEIEED